MKSPIDFLNEHYIQSTKAQIIVVWLSFLVCVALAPWYDTWAEVFLIGLPAALVPTALSRLMPISRITRVSVGLSYMIISALMIHQGHGMIELHFGIFIYLAFLLFFRDWLPIVAAAALIAIHHLSFNFLQASGSGVFLFSGETGIELVLIHAAYVVIETAVLVYMAILLHREAIEGAEIKTVAQYLNTKDGNICLNFNMDTLNTKFGHQFEAYFGALRTVIGKVSEGSHVVAYSTEEISEGNTSLAQRTEEQACSLQAIASSLSEITNAVKHNSENTLKVDQLTEKASQDAINGVEVISNAVAAMAEISQSNAKITNIITAIDDVAFQTNLLALNASVEAAHAGEQGRGFAIVAEEVRTLAKRTAEAAQETNILIKDSISKINKGNELVGSAGLSLKQISQTINELSSLVSDIARESSCQLTNIEQINFSVQEMDNLTQQNTSLVEEIATASSTMNGEAQQLISVVSSFKLASSDTERA